MVQCWTTETIIYHVAKDIVRRCIGIKLDETHHYHFLQVSKVGGFLLILQSDMNVHLFSLCYSLLVI